MSRRRRNEPLRQRVVGRYQRRTGLPTAHHGQKTWTFNQEKAQLTQRSRAMLRVIGYFAKSLNVTQVIENDTIR